MIKIFTRQEWEKTGLRRDFQSWEEEERAVREILQEVRSRGDAALREFAGKFDGCSLEGLRVTGEELAEAREHVEPEFMAALGRAIANIEKFHRSQLKNSHFYSGEGGVLLGHLVLPLDRVGAYVPGGTAPYPSSVLMTVIPAQVAGVREIYLVTPPGREGKVNPYTLAAAAELGVTGIFKVGGAQAVGALAYGTETVPAVDKIVGPGNIYVTLAKKLVFGDVDIDMLAGPSELLVIADASARPEFIAADLMSQAEHDPRSANFLVTVDHQLPRRVLASLEEQLALLPRQEIITRSLGDYSAIILVQDLEEAFEVSNQVAPEHLEVMVERPWDWVHSIRHAGSVFLGHHTPEPLGDYYAGPNHVLPTGGAARFSSGLNVDDYTKKSSLLYYPPAALEAVADDVVLLAETEGLQAHANTVKVRRKSIE